MDNKTFLIGLGAAGIGYMAINGGGIGGIGGGSGGGSSGGSGGGSSDGQVPISEAGEMILDGEVPDVDSWGSDDPFEDASNTGTTPLGNTATEDEFESIVEELQGGYETPTPGAGGHVM